MDMPEYFYNSVFDNFDNWMDFSFPSFNQRLYGASSSQPDEDGCQGNR